MAESSKPEIWSTYGYHYFWKLLRLHFVLIDCGLNQEIMIKNKQNIISDIAIKQHHMVLPFKSKVHDNLKQQKGLKSLAYKVRKIKRWYQPSAMKQMYSEIKMDKIEWKAYKTVKQS